MSDPVPQAIARERNAVLKPTFLRALSGVWLFAWRSQFTWQRLPMRVLSLLVLPVLIYLTTFPAERWAQRHTLLGNPADRLNALSDRLRRADIRLEPEQRAQLQRIFLEEFARAESDQREGEPPESNAGRESEKVQACYDRIGNRAKSVLDERQFARLQEFARRSVLLSQRRSSEPLWGRTAPFYHWLIDFYFFMILPLNCVRVCGGLIRDELQANTLGFLTTRPLSRARLVIVKYLSQVAWLQIIMLIETLLLFAAGGLRHIPSLGALLPLILAVQLLAVFAWSALAAFLGQVSSRYIAVALVYGAIVELGIGRIPTNINTLSLMRHLKTLLAHNPALQSMYEWSGTGVWFSLGALALATAIFLGLAALLFTFKEYHHTVEMQK
jgi:ABC-2 type transport system permease protein